MCRAKHERLAGLRWPGARLDRLPGGRAQPDVEPLPQPGGQGCERLVRVCGERQREQHPGAYVVQRPDECRDAALPAGVGQRLGDLCQRRPHRSASGQYVKALDHLLTSCPTTAPVTAGRLGPCQICMRATARSCRTGSRPTTTSPIELVSGNGCRVTDAEGRSYLDFFGGILTNMLGYDVPEVREAVERQLATGIVHTSTLYLIRSQVELAEKIAKLSGIPNAKVFFTNSGTEANETALLLATAARQCQPGARDAEQLPRPLVRRGRDHRQRGWKSRALAPFGVHYLHGTDRQLPAFATACPTPTTSTPASRTCATCWPPRPPGTSRA